MPSIEKFSKFSFVGVLKPCCTISNVHTKALTTAHLIKFTSKSSRSARPHNTADAPLIDAEFLFKKTGPAQTQRFCHDKLRWRDAGTNGSQPGAERVPNELGAQRRVGAHQDTGPPCGVDDGHKAHQQPHWTPQQIANTILNRDVMLAINRTGDLLHRFGILKQ